MKQLIIIFFLFGFVENVTANDGLTNSQTRDGQTVGQLKGPEVPCEVVNAFKKDFNSASEIKWSDNTFFFQVEFTYAEKRLFAFYSLEGKFMGLYRHISSTELPGYLRNSIREDYPNYWITELFQLSKKAGDAYYLTLQNADDKIMLKSQYGTDWKVVNYQF